MMHAFSSHGVRSSTEAEREDEAPSAMLGLLHVDRWARKGYRALVKKTRREPKKARRAVVAAEPKSAAGVSVAFERGPHRGLARPEIGRRIHAMIDDLQLKNIEVSFVLTNDECIHQLNKIYRG